MPLGLDLLRVSGFSYFFFFFPVINEISCEWDPPSEKRDLRLVYMKTTYSKLFHSKLNYFSDIQQLWFLSQKTTLEMKFQFTHSVLSDSPQPHGLQQMRLTYLSPTPGACSNSCPSSQWCHPTISSSVIPFSSCHQSFPASGTSPISQFFTSGNQSIGVSASASVLPMNNQDWFLLGLTSWISLQSKGLSKSLLQHHSSKDQFFCTQFSFFFNINLFILIGG